MRTNKETLRISDSSPIRSRVVPIVNRQVIDRLHIGRRHIGNWPILKLNRSAFGAGRIVLSQNQHPAREGRLYRESDYWHEPTPCP
ncbi:MAG: hypothetical protein EAS49_11125 [Brucella intermedia]|nr:MAG: hypothetical protein EAS49_11125 [Brucella intermedia]